MFRLAVLWILLAFSACATTKDIIYLRQELIVEQEERIRREQDLFIFLNYLAQGYKNHLIFYHGFKSDEPKQRDRNHGSAGNGKDNLH